MFKERSKYRMLRDYFSFSGAPPQIELEELKRGEEEEMVTSRLTEISKGLSFLLRS